MDEKALAGLLGLAMRSGQLKAGAQAALEDIRQGRAGLLLLDLAASPNTTKRMTDACQTHQVRCLRLPEELLGNAIGKQGTMAATLSPGGICEKVNITWQDQDSE
jgi:ribosomal protein L7Ae-like RNA K-turn-binding protein